MIVRRVELSRCLGHFQKRDSNAPNTEIPTEAELCVIDMMSEAAMFPRNIGEYHNALLDCIEKNADSALAMDADKMNATTESENGTTKKID